MGYGFVPTEIVLPTVLRFRCMLPHPIKLQFDVQRSQKSSQQIVSIRPDYYRTFKICLLLQKVKQMMRKVFQLTFIKDCNIDILQTGCLLIRLVLIKYKGHLY